MGCTSSKSSSTVQITQVRSISVYNTTILSQEDKSSPQSVSKPFKKASFDGLYEVLSFSPSLLDIARPSNDSGLYSHKIPLINHEPKAHCIVYHLASVVPAKSFNYVMACKKGIKYISKVALTGSHVQNINKDSVGTFLKRVKVCKSLNVMENINSLPYKKRLMIRKSTFGLAKSIKAIGASRITKKLAHLKNVQAGNVDYISQISFLPNLMSLKISKLISAQNNNEKAIKKLSRLKNLKSLHIKTEDFSALTLSQRDLSRAIKKLSQFKKINLHCSLNSQPNPNAKQAYPEIYPRLSFWQKITELSLDFPNNSYPVKNLLTHIKRFESLGKLSLKLKPETSQDFVVYQELSALEQIRELNLEVKASNGLRKGLISFFECTKFPKGLRILNIKLIAMKSFSVLSKASKECNFFESLESLRSLTSFKCSVRGEEVTPKPRNIRAPFVFFHFLTKRLPRILRDLNISAYNSVTSSCWSPLISQDQIVSLIAERLNHLETLKMNILGVSLSPESLQKKVLPKLKVISLGNLLLSIGLFRNFYTEQLEEFKLSCPKETETADLEWFLREMCVFRSLKGLKLKMPKLKSQKISGTFAKELLGIFQSFEELRELSLILPSITIGVDVAKWFLGLCQCKKSLRLAKLEFRDYRIIKDVFCVSLIPCC